jgi:hypothetical protein
VPTQSWRGKSAVFRIYSTLTSNGYIKAVRRQRNLWLAMYLKYHKAGLTPTTSVTSTAISSVKMAIGHKSLTNLRSEMIFLQGKPVFYIFLPSTPPYWQIILRFCWLWTPTWQQKRTTERRKMSRDLLSLLLPRRCP